MGDFLVAAVLKWVTSRRVLKRRTVVATGLKELNALSVTYHGRIMLAGVINDPDNELEPELRRMYLVILQSAPVEVWAKWN